MRDGEFAALIDGLSGLQEARPKYRHDALEVYAGALDDGDGKHAVELRAVPADAGSAVEGSFSEAVQSWWSVSDVEGILNLLRWGLEPRPWALVADDGSETLATAWETIDDGTVTAVVRTVGETLVSAGAEGVAHGNLRPGHVRLTGADPAALVDDWGLGRAVAEADAGAFVTGFTAPEQLDGSAAAGTDVDTYGLAALAYFTLTERPPFPEDRATILEERPQPVSAFRPDLSDAVGDVVMRGLRRDPDERPDGPGAFAAEFEDAMAGEGTGTAAGGAAAGGVAADDAATGSADTTAGGGVSAGEEAVSGDESEDRDGVTGAGGGAAAAGGAAAGGAGDAVTDSDTAASDATANGNEGRADTGSESGSNPPGSEELPAESGPVDGGETSPLADEDAGPLAGDDSGLLAEDEPDSGEQGAATEPFPENSNEGGAGAEATAGESSRVNRRTVLAGGGLLAALAAVGAGAWALLGGGGSGSVDLSVVPDRAETIAAVDVAGLRESDALATALDARLPLALPLFDGDTLAGVLDRVATRTGMDPGGVQEALVFAARSAGPETYAGLVLETGWDGDSLSSSLEEAGESLAEETYADSRLFVAGYADLAFPVAVGEVAEGRYAVGTRPEVEDVLETANGSTPSVGGREVEAFRAAAEGQVRVGSLLPPGVVSAAVPGSVPEQVAAAVTATARNVEYVSGSVGADGSARLRGEAGSAEAAETAAAQLRAASTLAADELEGSEGPLATLARLLDGASVSQDETTVTVSLDGAYELLAASLAAAEQGAV